MAGPAIFVFVDNGSDEVGMEEMHRDDPTAQFHLSTKEANNNFLLWNK